MAGYSQTSLVKKLGIKVNYCCFFAKSPPKYFQWRGPLPQGAVVRARLTGQLDFIHLFVSDRKSLEKEFILCQKHVKDSGMLWISWPKKASKVPTDIDENIVRDIGVHNRLVDVKVCAIYAVWSGLKFVVRVKDRE